MSGAVRAVGRTIATRVGRDLSLCAVAASCGVSAGAEEVGGDAAPASAAQLRQLHVDDTVGDLLGHPAFAGFARLLLPWDDRHYDTSMRLRDIGALLPYHTHVDPAVVVSSLNRMVADVAGGRAVFHDFYSGGELGSEFHSDPAANESEPSLRNAGLFFFRGKPGAPFAVIAPGGGFAYIGSLHEGFPCAHEISRRGYNAFVLKYRAGRGGRVATKDLAAALTYVVAHAAELEVATTGYSLWGSSAGARMAAAIGSHGTARFGGAALPRPSAVVMLYTGHADVAPSEPPTFVAAGENDQIAPPAVMERRVAILRRLGTDVAYRRYPGVGHGFGPGVGTTAEGWIAAAMRFWTKHIKQQESHEERVR
jgi:acetyl esterase/lipase